MSKQDQFTDDIEKLKGIMTEAVDHSIFLGMNDIGDNLTAFVAYINVKDEGTVFELFVRLLKEEKRLIKPIVAALAFHGLINDNKK